MIVIIRGSNMSKEPVMCRHSRGLTESCSSRERPHRVEALRADAGT
jgi:hypothetical protein